MKSFFNKIETYDPTTNSRFIYLNNFLKNLEEYFQLTDTITEEKFKKSNKKFKNLIELRKGLGLVFNERGVYEILINFTEDLAKILKKNTGLIKRRF
ncbi:MAG: hypothetical protein EU532_13210 [Promethearchaeota archaeon]|nr:MAG: hypothetical protein EU532_13210 [Candidatus Lokiarchaeota archaeon]